MNSRIKLILGILNISKGTYDETFQINQAVTLSAPVGKVIIGKPGNSNSRSGGTSLPSTYFTENERSDGAAEELSGSTFFQGYPNPFQERIQLQYNVNREGPVTIKVFDRIGAEVSTLFRGAQPAGNHKVVWDGRHHTGKPAVSGLYIVQFQLGTETHTTKIIKQ